MNRFKISLVVLALALPMFATLAKADVQSDRFELGINGGIGFYVGQKNPLLNSPLQRVQTYDVIAFGDKGDWGWPGIENFGFSAGYRFDTRWHVKLQTARQRLCFAEFASDQSDKMKVYYNAMWHLDAMAEYNILPFGMNDYGVGVIKNIVPYVGFGVGMTMYNENATLRAIEKDHASSNFTKHGPMFPRVGFMATKYDTEQKKVEEWAKDTVRVAAYIPVAFGVKMRLNDNVQLKGTFQYNFYPKANLEGYTRDTAIDKENIKAGVAHNSMFTISAIFNLGRWYEDRLITY